MANAGGASHACGALLLLLLLLLGVDFFNELPFLATSHGQAHRRRRACVGYREGKAGAYPTHRPPLPRSKCAGMCPWGLQDALRSGWAGRGSLAWGLRALRHAAIEALPTARSPSPSPTRFLTMVRITTRRIRRCSSVRALRAPLMLAFFALVTPAPCLAQRYILDDASVDYFTTQNATTSMEACAIQGFTVPGGGSDLIRNISAVLTPYWYSQTANAPIDGLPLRIAVWDDPNGDRHPSDAVLLASSSGHVVSNTDTGEFVTYTFAQPVPVSGSFFIGTSIPSRAPTSAVCSIDDSQGYRWDSWFVSNSSGPVDLVHLDQNSNGPHNILLTGRYMLRANDGDYGAPIGQSSCLALPNSEGKRGRLSASGRTDQANGAWRVVLTATDVPLDAFGFYLASQTQVAPHVPVNSMGRLCLGGHVLRIGPSLSLASGRSIMWDVDLGNIDSFGAAVPGVDVVAAGQSWTFQCWHRDLDPGPTSNLTEAITVTFQ